MKKIGMIALLIFLLNGWAVRAQNKILIEGKVVDAGSLKPVAKAWIYSTESQIQAETGKDGTFRIYAIPGELLNIYAEGYKPVSVKAVRNPVIKLEANIIALNEVVVEADPLRDPIHSTVVSDAEKRVSQPRNAADLFKDIPGFTLQKRSATSLEPSLRSFKYDQMNIKYDGGFKIVNACPNHMDPVTAHVIPEEVGKIEVIKGPFNVRFGQTFGAVVNMITRKPAPDRFGLHHTLQTGYETNGNNFVGRTEIMYARKKYDIAFNGEYRNFGDYTDGNGNIVPAGFHAVDYSFKLGCNPKDDSRLLIDWRQNFTRDVKHAGLPMDSPKDDSYLIGVDYRTEKLPGKIKAWQVKAYHSYVNHLMTNGYGMPDPRPNYPAIDARTPVYSMTHGGKLEVEYQPKKDWLFYVGTDVDAVARDGIKKVVINNNLNTGVPLNLPMVKYMKVWQNSQINDFGFYLQMSWKRNKEQVITAGLRADYVWAIAKDPAPQMLQIYGQKAADAQTDLVFSGNIGWKYHKDGRNIQVAFGRGTRTPNMAERYIYRFIIGEDSREYIGNPFLKPEVNNQVEISYTRNWEQISLGTDLYYSYFQDYIVPVLNSALTPSTGSCGRAPTAPKQFINVDAYQYGFDIYAIFHPVKEWKFKFDYSYIKAYNLSLNEPLAQVNPPVAHLQVKYEQDKYWIDWRAEWMAAQKDFAPSFGETETPGHLTLDLRAAYKPAKHLIFGLAVTNLTNAAYYYHTNFRYRNAVENTGNFIYEPGRNFSFMLTYKF